MSYGYVMLKYLFPAYKTSSKRINVGLAGMFGAGLFFLGFVVSLVLGPLTLFYTILIIPAALALKGFLDEISQPIAGVRAPVPAFDINRVSEALFGKTEQQKAPEMYKPRVIKQQVVSKKRKQPVAERIRESLERLKRETEQAERERERRAKKRELKETPSEEKAEVMTTYTKITEPLEEAFGSEEFKRKTARDELAELSFGTQFANVGDITGSVLDKMTGLETFESELEKEKKKKQELKESQESPGVPPSE